MHSHSPEASQTKLSHKPLGKRVDGGISGTAPEQMPDQLRNLQKTLEAYRAALLVVGL